MWQPNNAVKKPAVCRTVRDDSTEARAMGPKTTTNLGRSAAALLSGKGATLGKTTRKPARGSRAQLEGPRPNALEPFSERSPMTAFVKKASRCGRFARQILSFKCLQVGGFEGSRILLIAIIDMRLGCRNHLQQRQRRRPAKR